MKVTIHHDERGASTGLKVITVRAAEIHELVPGSSITIDVDEKELIGLEVIDLSEMSKEPVRPATINCGIEELWPENVDVSSTKEKST